MIQALCARAAPSHPAHPGLLATCSAAPVGPEMRAARVENGPEHAEHRPSAWGCPKCCRGAAPAGFPYRSGGRRAARRDILGKWAMHPGRPRNSTGRRAYYWRCRLTPAIQATSDDYTPGLPSAQCRKREGVFRDSPAGAAAGRRQAAGNSSAVALGHDSTERRCSGTLHTLTSSGSGLKQSAFASAFSRSRLCGGGSLFFPAHRCTTSATSPLGRGGVPQDRVQKPVG